MLIIVFDLTYHTYDPYDTLPCVIPFFNVLACFLGKVILFQDSEQSLWSSQMMKKLRSSRLPDDEVDSLLAMNIRV